MMCKKPWNKHVRTAMLGLGIVSFLFGLLTFLIGKPDGHTTNTLLGMFTGFGAGIIGVAVWGTIREKVLPKEKLEPILEEMSFIHLHKHLELIPIQSQQTQAPQEVQGLQMKT